MVTTATVVKSYYDRLVAGYDDGIMEVNIWQFKLDVDVLPGN